MKFEHFKPYDIDDLDLYNEHEDNYDRDPGYDNWDWEKENWDALTDGQYGDYPGPGFDYEVLGF